MSELTNEQKKELEISVIQLKKAYEELAQNKIVIDDLREYCALTIPTDLSGNTKDLDVNKVLIQTGAARVMQRIDYFVNTPIEQILKRYKGA